MNKVIKIEPESLYAPGGVYALKDKIYPRHETMCDQAWNYVQFFPQRNAVNYCCRTPPLELADQEIEEQGTEIFWNPRHVVQRRKDMLAGKKPQDCQVCWKLEMNGLQSKRTTRGIMPELRKSHPSIPDNATLKSTNIPWDDYYTSKSTRIIEIILGNTCDSKCVYCSDYFSSLWAQEKRKYGEQVYMTWENDFDSPFVKVFWDYVEESWATLPHLNFIGGEPIVMKDFFKYLDKLLEIAERIPNTGIKKTISVITNGNTPTHLLDRFLTYSEKLSTYFNITVQVSGENTGEQLEYVRFGTTWDQWSANVERYAMSLYIELQFLPAIQLLSIPSLSHYIDFITDLYIKHKKPFTLHWATVSWPEEFNLDFIPLEMLHYIDTCLESLTLLHYMSETAKQRENIDYWMSSLKKVKELSKNQNLCMLENHEWAINFKKFFDKLDERRGTTWWKTFPEFAMIKEITNV